MDHIINFPGKEIYFEFIKGITTSLRQSFINKAI